MDIEIVGAPTAVEVGEADAAAAGAGGDRSLGHPAAHAGVGPQLDGAVGLDIDVVRPPVPYRGGEPDLLPGSPTPVAITPRGDQFQSPAAFAPPLTHSATELSSRT